MSSSIFTGIRLPHAVQTRKLRFGTRSIMGAMLQDLEEILAMMRLSAMRITDGSASRLWLVPQRATQERCGALLGPIQSLGRMEFWLLAVMTSKSSFGVKLRHTSSSKPRKIRLNRPKNGTRKPTSSSKIHPRTSGLRQSTRVSCWLSQWQMGRSKYTNGRTRQT